MVRKKERFKVTSLCISVNQYRYLKRHKDFIIIIIFILFYFISVWDDFNKRSQIEHVLRILWYTHFLVLFLTCFSGMTLLHGIKFLACGIAGKAQQR